MKKIKNYSKLLPFPLGSITARGFLREQLLRNKEGMGGHLDELEPEMIALPFVDRKYVNRWGDGDQAGWGAEISGNYWTGLIELAFSLGDEELIKKATDWVNAVIKKQQADGYLGTYTQEKDNPFEDYNAWGTACGMRGLLAFYEATGRKDVLEAVHRCMLWFCDNWAGDKKTSYSGVVIIEPMVFCYRYTGDERLIKFAEEYSDYLCKHDIFHVSYKSFLNDGLIFNSEHTAGMGTHSRLPAILYSATGNKDYLRASEKILNEVHKKATHITGSPVSINEYLGPVYSTAETEYCTYTVFSQTNYYMSYISGKSVYGDRLEETFYNGAQGARKKDEKAIAYLSAPNQIYATKDSSSAYWDMQVYAPCYPVACCPVNAVALLGTFVRSMFLTDRSGNVYANAYGPCLLNRGGVEIEEVTEYPFRENVSFRVKRADNITFFLRLPKWSDGFTLTKNGAAIDAKANRDGFIPVEKVSSGDVIEIVFNARVEVLRIKDDFDKRPIALRRGALVYSLHLPEKWNAYPGSPNTPLPEGWSWFNVEPVFEEADCHDYHEKLGRRKEKTCWNVVLSEKLSPDNVTVEQCDDGGYVWENPRIKLHLKGYRAPFLCAPYPARTFEAFGKKQITSEELDLTLVPYGCTNLRITYFFVKK